MCQCLVYGAQVLLDDLLTLLAVGVADRLANGFNSLFARQNLGDSEEARLHNRVHARAHARLASHLIGVNYVELGLLGNQLLLDFAGQVAPDLTWSKRAVEQENSD